MEKKKQLVEKMTGNWCKWSETGNKWSENGNTGGAEGGQREKYKKGGEKKKERQCAILVGITQKQYTQVKSSGR